MVRYLSILIPPLSGFSLLSRTDLLLISYKKSVHRHSKVISDFHKLSNARPICGAFPLAQCAVAQTSSYFQVSTRQTMQLAKLVDFRKIH
nr:MAG TPA: hypothetical protein [Caudoviricetes sp.]